MRHRGLLRPTLLLAGGLLIALPAPACAGGADRPATLPAAAAGAEEDGPVHIHGLG